MSSSFFCHWNRRSSSVASTVKVISAPVAADWFSREKKRRFEEGSVVLKFSIQVFQMLLVVGRAINLKLTVCVICTSWW